MSCVLTHSQWSDPLLWSEVKPPEVIEGGTWRSASTKDIHRLVKVAGAVGVTFSDSTTSIIRIMSGVQCSLVYRFLEVSMLQLDDS